MNDSDRNEMIGIGAGIVGKANKDAIHIAIAPVVANEPLKPGQHVNINKDGKAVAAVPAFPYVGVVDPFLMVSIEPGQQFWLFLRPGTVTSLRHEWNHPAFPVEGPMRDAATIDRSRAWLSRFADEYSTSLNYMIEGAAGGEHVSFGDDDGPDAARQSAEEFWHHMEVVTGRLFDENHRNGITFGCSCG